MLHHVNPRHGGPHADIGGSWRSRRIERNDRQKLAGDVGAAVLLDVAADLEDIALDQRVRHQIEDAIEDENISLDRPVQIQLTVQQSQVALDGPIGCDVIGVVYDEGELIIRSRGVFAQPIQRRAQSIEPVAELVERQASRGDRHAAVGALHLYFPGRLCGFIGDIGRRAGACQGAQRRCENLGGGLVRFGRRRPGAQCFRYALGGKDGGAPEQRTPLGIQCATGLVGRPLHSVDEQHSAFEADRSGRSVRERQRERRLVARQGNRGCQRFFR